MLVLSLFSLRFFVWQRAIEKIYVYFSYLLIICKLCHMCRLLYERNKQFRNLSFNGVYTSRLCVFFFVCTFIYIRHCYWPNGEKYSNHVIEIRGYGNRMNITCIDISNILNLIQSTTCSSYTATAPTETERTRRFRPIEKLFGQRDWKMNCEIGSNVCLPGVWMKCKDTEKHINFCVRIYPYYNTHTHTRSILVVWKHKDKVFP